MQPLLRLSRVSKGFGGVKALDGVDWELMRGEIHCLIGENGSGKSTLIKLVAGVHAPDPGSTIEIDGQAAGTLSPGESKALGIHVIFQDLSLFPNLSVAENIAIDDSVRSFASPVRSGRIQHIARSVLERLGLAIPLGAPVGDLPIAARQVVAICRGLAARARLLFMDEPTSSLTRTEVRSLLDIVTRLKSDGITVVFVSHRLDEVIEIADRITVLRDGKKVGTYPAATMNSQHLTELMTGLTIEQRLVARDTTSARPMLEVSGLARAGEYEDVSFVLRRGEVLGITGLLGAGRTELALSLFGMTRPDRGAIRLDGQPITLGSNRDAIRAGIAYVPEDRLNLGLNMRQSVKDNLVLATLSRLSNRLGWLDPGKRSAAASASVEHLNIKIPGLDHPVQTLSGGNQQRVVLAKWLATAPKVLLLDSPTVGVDIGNKQGIYEIIHALAERGVGIVLISDEIPEVYYNCDRVLHMREGRLVGEHQPRAIDIHELEARVYA